MKLVVIFCTESGLHVDACKHIYVVCIHVYIDGLVQKDEAPVR